jgi:hypothetical protein
MGGKGLKRGWLSYMNLKNILRENLKWKNNCHGRKVLQQAKRLLFWLDLSTGTRMSKTLELWTRNLIVKYSILKEKHTQKEVVNDNNYKYIKRQLTTVYRFSYLLHTVEVEVSVVFYPCFVCGLLVWRGKYRAWHLIQFHVQDINENRAENSSSHKMLFRM